LDPSRREESSAEREESSPEREEFETFELSVRVTPRMLSVREMGSLKPTVVVAVLSLVEEEGGLESEPVLMTIRMRSLKTLLGETDFQILRINSEKLSSSGLGIFFFATGNSDCLDLKFICFGILFGFFR